MADYYEYEQKTDGTRVIRPRDNPGLSGIFIFIMILLILPSLIGVFVFRGVITNQSIESTERHPSFIGSQIDSSQNNEETDAYYLADLPVHDSHSDVLGNNIREESITDPFGEEHKGPNIILSSFFYAGGIQKAYTEFCTDAQYNYFFGTYYPDAEYEGKMIAFRIYGDGELLYDSGFISRGERPRSFEISIEGVEILRVEAMASGGYGTSAQIVLADAAVYN